MYAFTPLSARLETNNHSWLIACHNAALTIAGRVLGVAIRPPSQRSGLRLFRGDVFEDDNDRSAEGLERLALVALAGHAALARIKDGADDRDDLLARDLVFAGLYKRYGPSLTPSFVRGYIRSRTAELTNEAERLVGESWTAIEAEAERQAVLV